MEPAWHSDLDYLPGLLGNDIDLIAVSHVQGVGIFYGFLDKDPSMDKDTNKITKDLSQIDKIRPKEKPQLNQMYAVYSNTDERLYRCRVSILALY
jgi:hypothetical protein